MIFKLIEHAWSRIIKEQAAEFKQRVPSLVSLSVISLDKEFEDRNKCVIIFTEFNEAVQEAKDIPLLKETIKRWLQKIGFVRIRRSDNNSFIVELTDVKARQVDEAVVKVFTRKNNTLVPAMKCLGGPKNGQRTQDVKTCMEPPSYARRTARKVSARKNKGSIAKKRQKTKLTNIIGRKRLKKANDRLKKARGGKF